MLIRLGLAGRLFTRPARSTPTVFLASFRKMTSAAEKAPVFHSLGLPLHFAKRPVDLTLIQLGQTSDDKRKNLEHAKRSIHAAVSKPSGRDANTRLVVLPECWNSPYGVHYFDTYAEDFGDLYERVKAPLGKRTPIANAAHVVSNGEQSEVQAARAQQDALVQRWTVDGANGESFSVRESNSETLRMLSDVAKELGVVLVGGSIPERDTKTGKLYNTASVFNEQGELISLHRKLHLFDIDIPGKMTFQESKTLTAGDRITVFECLLGRFGLAICYDLRFPECATVAARLGAGAILYPGAFNTTTGPRSWELLQRGRAADGQIYVVSCSPARPTQEQIDGPDKAYPTYGFSMVVDPWGKVVSSLDEKEGTLSAQLSREQIEEVRTFVPTSRQRRFDVYPDVASAV